jgi:hypothetical protein
VPNWTKAVEETQGSPINITETRLLRLHTTGSTTGRLGAGPFLVILQVTIAFPM